jgi:di/tricarboxylate transporter
VAIVVVLFIWNRVPVAVVALGTSLALYATGILDAKQAMAGLGDPVVIFLASLFVVSAGLESAGVTTWAGQLLVRKAGASRARLLVLLMLVAALFTAMIGFVGAVAALVPVAVVAAVRFGIPTSQLMIPLAFSASAGGLLTLTASPVNVLMSNAVGYAGLREFAFFEFALAGLPLVAGTVAIILLLGSRLLPHRNGASMPVDFSTHARTLVEQYRLRDGLHHLRVRATSPYVGMARDDIDLAKYPGVRLVSLEAGERTRGRATIAEGDVLLVRGDAPTAALLATEAHLAFRSEGDVDVSETLFNRESGLAEVVIPPRSAVIGRKVFPGMATTGGDLIVLAVQRGGEDFGAGEVTLQPGDHVLLQGTWEALDRYLDDPQVLVVDSPEVVRRQALALGPGSVAAIAILAALVAMLASGQVPAVIAGSACAGAMVLTRVLTVQQAYRGIDWNTVLLIGGMIPLSTAMTQTGAAQLLADALLGLVGQAGPYAVLAGLFVLTAVLGQLISNTATALIIAPIAVAAAIELGVSPRALVMSITVAAACSFFTPVATPPNLMVMGPGGYRFGDYWKLGLPLTVWFFLVAVFWVPVVWRF